jgi:hypothetical protein
MLIDIAPRLSVFPKKSDAHDYQFHINLNSLQYEGESHRTSTY